jgi:hypothetical protein
LSISSELDSCFPSIGSIGFTGIKKCYLNITEEEAIKLYCIDENLSIEQFNETKIPIDTFNFNNQFNAYDVWD